MYYMEANAKEEFLFSDKGKVLMGYLPIVEFTSSHFSESEQTFVRHFIYHKCLLFLLWSIQDMKGAMLDTIKGKEFFYVALAGMLGKFISLHFQHNKHVDTLGDAPELAKISLTLSSYCRTCTIPSGMKGNFLYSMPHRNYLSFLRSLSIMTELEGKRKIIPGKFIHMFLLPPPPSPSLLLLISLGYIFEELFSPEYNVVDDTLHLFKLGIDALLFEIFIKLVEMKAQPGFKKIMHSIINSLYHAMTIIPSYEGILIRWRLK